MLGAVWNAARGGMIGRARAAPGGIRFGVRLPTDAGVTAPLPAAVFLALFLAVIALRLGEDDESASSMAGLYRIVLVERLLVWAFLPERSAATRVVG